MLLCFESQMTLGTAIQADYIFIDQLASLSTEQTSGGDTPEEIQDSSGNSTDGRADNSQRTSRTAPRTMPTITVAPPAVIPVAVPTVLAR